LLVCVTVCISSASAAAQEPTTEVPNLPLHLGTLGLSPQVRVSSIYDTNVYNVKTDPEADLVTSVAPQTRIFTKLGRMMIDGRAELSAEYYRTNTEQNSVNTLGAITLTLPSNRVTPYVTYTALSSRERFGFEIDDRPRRNRQGITAAVDVRVASKTVLVVRAQREGERFGDDTAFRGANLPQVLNREMDLAGVTLRHPISALTTLSVSVDRAEDRFEFLPDRNARGRSVSGGLTFKPTALITGAFTIGYLHFAPVQRSTSEFKGLVTSADLGYVLRGVTRFGVQAQRNVTYSYDPSTPYYVLAGFDVTATHRAGERWAISARLGRHLLNYVSSVTVGTPIAGELGGSTDKSALVGVGLIHQLSRDTQIAVDVDRQRRLSEQTIRQFESTRVRTTLGLRF
jgi:hypothetical protein